jgi:hypothetical protein
MLGRSLAAVGVVFALGACGGRTTLRVFNDGTPDDASQAGAAGPISGIGGSSGDGGRAGTGNAGQGGSGAGGHGAENSAGDGSAGMSAGSSGTGGAGSGGAGFGGAAGFAAGQGAGGVGGGPGPAGEGGGAAGMAGDILNPHGCATPNPFVLSIDPIGSSGTVRGWLESTAGLVFEDQLPRFVRAFDDEMPFSDRSIVLWWSIGSVGSDGQGQLYFYDGAAYTNSATEIAVAHGASRFVDIDIDALDFGLETIEARTGTFVVFRNTLTDETLGLRVDQIVITDAAGDSLCAAVDASWRFLSHRD